MIIAILSLLTVVAISMLITRLAAMALILTGMSGEAAKFQARSALAGVGFTTREAEQVVDHPVRRRIIMLLMLVGSVSMPTVIAALAVSLITTLQSEHWWRPVLFLAAGLLTLGLVARSRRVSKRVNLLLAWGLKRWTDLEVQDYVSLLQLQNGYAVTEMVVEPGDWLAGKTLQEAALSQEGILVLGIQRPDGAYIGAAQAGDRIQANDKLVLYARTDRVKELDQRAVALGDLAHQRAKDGCAVETLQRDSSNQDAPRGVQGGNARSDVIQQ